MEEEKTTKQEFEEKIYSDEEELKPIPDSKIVKKELFLRKDKVLILGVKKNRFGKQVLNIKGSSNDKSGDLVISNKDFNMLIEKFGNKPRSWIGKEVYVESKFVPATESLSEGYQVSLTLN